MKAPKTGTDGKAPVLVIEQGAQIIARGTADKPITFTTSETIPTLNKEAQVVEGCTDCVKAQRGLWGGLIICGKATTAKSTGATAFTDLPEVEGLTGVKYGGSNAGGAPSGIKANDADNSGELSYVRVWHGGAVIGKDNEINGITFAGVGSSTLVEHVEVAYNADDGLEFFGGTVNVKYASVLFVEDDALDTDEGYQGKLQFVFVMLAIDSHHGAEMDNGSKDNPDRQPRSFPQVYNAIFVGHENNSPSPRSSDTKDGAMLRLREGTGGRFANIIITNIGSDSPAVKQDFCGSEKRSSTEPTTSGTEYLWFDSRNVVWCGKSEGCGTMNLYDLDASCQSGGAISDTPMSVSDPELVLLPRTSDEFTEFLDPRAVQGGASYTNAYNVPSDGFFENTGYRGGFGGSLWMARWSALAEGAKLPDDVYGPVLNKDITTSTTLRSSDTHLLAAQVTVKSGATLTIEAGTTILCYGDDGQGKAPSLIIEKGAKIMAAGTSARPITFTSVKPAAQRGPKSWGGLIILGNAPISKQGGTNEVEGIVGGTYGGNNPSDNSGTLQYVRAWYGGEPVGENNEINGITFAGVGSGTTIDHIEVAFNFDDGVEFFGGTAQVKYLSLIANGDDSIDTDEGYQGKIQHAFVMLGSYGHHGTEMDSKTDDNIDSTPRSFPQLYNALFIGQRGIAPAKLKAAGSSDDLSEGLMRLREGTGGQFGNLILTNSPNVGVKNDKCCNKGKCASVTHVQTLGSQSGFDYLFFSSKNIISGATKLFDQASECTGTLTAAETADPKLQNVPLGLDEDSPFVDPRPKADSIARSSFDTVPSDGFFDAAQYRGGFSDSIWLSGWSMLSDMSRIPTGSLPSNDGELCGEITSDRNISGEASLTCQTFVKSGVTLTITAGTTIKASGRSGGKAPALVIQQGGKINAVGTADAPITFTTAASVTPGSEKSAMWGGLIICGKAPINTRGTKLVEGIEEDGKGTYGGNDPNDNSGTLQYVRVWYGGDIIGKDNEINGITLAGVGKGTTVSNIEVAFNKDDGVEFFGGTVDVKYMSVLFAEDDAIDTDLGYQGRIQYAFVLLDKNSHHGTEMDSKEEKDMNDQTRSFPQLYNALFVSTQDHSPGTASSDDLIPAVMRLREGTGGEFGNIIITNVVNAGVYQDACSGERRTSGTKPLSGRPGYLWFSQNNIIFGSGKDFDLKSGCAGLSSALRVDPNLASVPSLISRDMFGIDPRPLPRGAAFNNLDSYPQDGFFDEVSYKGAFGSELSSLWIAKYSWLASSSKLTTSAFLSDTINPISTEWRKDGLCGDWVSGNLVIKQSDMVNGAVSLTCQTFVKAGATITIEPGVTIKAPKTGIDGKAPVLVIEQGAQIIARGTADKPITFTTSETIPTLNKEAQVVEGCTDCVKAQRGLWGGLIICGKATTAKSTGATAFTDLPEVEGLTGVKYGGSNAAGAPSGIKANDADNSGELSYVRVWHGGAIIGVNNEINGITFAGVGSNTLVEHVEVAYNADDGLEFFGGTVNVKYASVLFVEDDALDTDEGYQGKLQFVFVMLAIDSNHGAEMDNGSKDSPDRQPRSFPQVYNAIFVGHENNSPSPRSSDARDSAMLRLREGTGGRFANIIITNIGSDSPAVKQNACGSEKRSSTEPTTSGTEYLWFDSRNVVWCGKSEGCGTMNLYDLDASCQSGGAISDTPMSVSDPELVLLPRTSDEFTEFLDPRAVQGGASYTNAYNVPSDGFFENTGYRGGFGGSLWMARWSALAEGAKLPDDVYGPVLNKDITTSTTLRSSDTHLLAAQVTVKSGATLTIEAGTTILCYGDDGQGKAPSLIIEKGAKIMAAGTSARPITFTSVKPAAQRGPKSWGGLIILGNAPISKQGGTNEVEGIVGGTYGGNNPSDNSGTLQYVRAWYGGEPVGENNEINGITFAGVGSGTTIDHIEVAFNFDDGVEFFGGTAQVKYLSLIANGDDSIDTDEGYQGKIQHAFVMLGSYGHHGTEMDSKTDDNIDSTPRSFPQLYNALFIGQRGIAPAKLKAAGSSDDLSEGLMRLREGTGGQFGNLILTNSPNVGVKNDKCCNKGKCASVTHVQTLGSQSGFDYLFFSSKNIISGATKLFDQASECTGTLTAAETADPQLQFVPLGLDEDSTFVDPRPKADSIARSSFDTVPSDGFFDAAQYRGGFSDSIWLSGWSMLSDMSRIPTGSLPSNDGELCGEITSDRTISGEASLTCQTFVKSGVTLTITAGTTIKASRSGLTGGKAPALIIQQGGKINAVGTADAPITFTTAASVTPGSEKSAMWGGLIICGKAPINTRGTKLVEGIEEDGKGTYGGNDPNDNSGTLQYVRVWYGGAIIGKDNEINGITLAGVGKGTTVSNIEVAFNKDDGVEFFGGTVDVKYMSVLFAEDDAIDTDLGYQGRIQYAFVLLDKNSHHGTEMDSKEEKDMNDQTRSFPQLYNALFVSTQDHSPGTASSDDLIPAVMRLREGTGGEFGNIIITNVVNAGVYQDACSGERRTSGTKPSSGRPGYLWFSQNNIIFGSGKDFDLKSGCAGLSSALRVDPNLASVPSLISRDMFGIDPRPLPGGAAFNNLDSYPRDGFFDEVSYKGAFGSELSSLWIAKYSWLASSNKLKATSATSPGGSGDAITLCGDITKPTIIKMSDMVPFPDGTLGVKLACQTFVKAGAGIEIAAGVTIKAPKVGLDGKAPVLVIEQGAQIIARGTADKPITFTTSETIPTLDKTAQVVEGCANCVKAQRGLWGGLIICGKATTAKSTGATAFTDLPEVEGLTGVKYGGSNAGGAPSGIKANDADNSGELSYVRVWHGGAVIGKDNEINGITFAGVGSSTLVEHVEVAYNADDGLEFFGGTVNVKYASVLFVEDDALDTDEGYQGKLQFVFVMLAIDSHHGAEMDNGSKDNPDRQPRSFPQVYNAIFVGHENNSPSPRSSDTKDGAMLRLREGTGGRFANIIITNIGSDSPAVKQDFCGSEKRSSTEPTTSGTEYLWFDSRNVVWCGKSEGCGTMNLYDLDASCQSGGAISDTPMSVSDPELVLLPRTSDEFTEFLDPRAVQGGASYTNAYNVPSDGFFENTGYRGGFGGSLWMARWSALAEGAKLPDDVYGPVLNKDITTDTTLKNVDHYLLAAQVTVKSGATLTIEAGTTIFCHGDDGQGKAPSLIIEKGAKIMAAGTSESPITFTSAKPAAQRGPKSWGGLIILGNAPISKQGGTNEVEGIVGGTYGGNNPSDNSGTLQYVRAWYGGEPVGRDNEINGITFAGVGSGTTIEHIEVAFNFDDGVEFFGGTAQVKYLSLIANGDDSIDTDEGYQGKIQHAFVMLGSYGNHGTEMDSKTDGNPDSKPRSFPQLYNALFIGQRGIAPAKLKAAGSSDTYEDGLMRLREGTGGQFGNLILTNAPNVGVKNDRCSPSVTHVQTLGSQSGFDYLFFSSKNIIFGANTLFDQDQDGQCTGALTAADNSDPQLQFVPFGLDEDSPFVDPRPKVGSNALSSYDSLPRDGFFDTGAQYRGAFSDSIWLSGWSILGDKIPRGTSLSSGEIGLCGEYSTNIVLRETDMVQQIDGSRAIRLSCQTFIKSGSRIEIEAGVTIKAPKVGLDGKAPVLVIEQGAQIIARGTADKPITFTTSETIPTLDKTAKVEEGCTDCVKAQRGLWGGLIICGKATTAKSTGATAFTDLPEVEGLTGVKYGGSNAAGAPSGIKANDADNSGELSYVRVWHGGAIIGVNNEINGITFAGVGSNTLVEHVEVAYNADDGLEFFGGTVNVKYASVLFVEDDALDTDEGYQGKLQFVFVMLAIDSNHGAEMDNGSKDSPDRQPRSFPQVYNAIFVGHENNSPSPRSSDARDSAMLRLREGTGGRFANIIITNIGSDSPAVKQNACGSEKRSSTEPTTSGTEYLWFDRNNVVWCGKSEGCGTMNLYDLDASCEIGGAISDTPMSVSDPELVLLPRTSDEFTEFLDPRAVQGGASYTNAYNVPSDGFFENTGYRGGFGGSLWMARWSALAEGAKLPDDVYGPVLNKDITTSTTLKNVDHQLLAAQVTVKSGATLTIEAGTTIFCYGDDGQGKAPSLIIEKGAKIMAAGTSASPITFTSAKPAAQRGPKSWGGLIILGNAPISKQGGTNEVEGIVGGTYGGNNPSDNSGTLQYVRAWYGGEPVGKDNEINGITFAGVGSGTTIDHIEVAFNFDDGVEFFGGTAQVKYLSLIANGDDSIDTDEGYQGKIQHAFVMLGSYGHHGTEMDSKTDDNIDSTPRSFPQLYNALFIGQRGIAPAKLKAAGSSDDLSEGLMRLREGTGGQFGNLILTNSPNVGVKNDKCCNKGKCASVTHVQTLGSQSGFDYLFFSSKNIIFGATKLFDQASECTGTLTAADQVSPDLEFVPLGLDEDSPFVDPRPKVDSIARSSYDTVPSDGFFDAAQYRGGFSDSIWLSGWSMLSDMSKIPRGALPSREETLCGEITSDRTISGEAFLTCQTFVKSGVTLTITAGTEIRASGVASGGKAPALIIQQGGKINAVGTADAPITFTSVVAPPKPIAALWGGLIICGKAPINTRGTKLVEGIEEDGKGTYGGNDPNDNSGTLQYVRVWYGGAIVGKDNEINGITLAGVGKGTTVSNIEVAFNKDDGVEFFGGTVDVKYMSVLFAEDDAIDTDQGYQGRIQYAFVLLDKNSHHGTEMDSKEEKDMNDQTRSFPQLYNALFVSTQDHSPGTASSDDLIPAVMRLREGTGGEFGNIIITNVVNAGVYQDACSGERRTSGTKPSSGRPGYLWFSQNNIIYGPGKAFDLKSGCAGLSSALRVDPNLASVPSELSRNMFGIDPRALPEGAAFMDIDDVPSDGWFEKVSYKGAFGSELSSLWIAKYSWLAVTKRLVTPVNLAPVPLYRVTSKSNPNETYDFNTEEEYKAWMKSKGFDEAKVNELYDVKQVGGVQTVTKKEEDQELASIIGGAVGAVAFFGLMGAGYMFYQRSLIQRQYDRLIADFQRSQAAMGSDHVTDEKPVVVTAV
ncbi:hypothetical protein RI054_13g63630 [Pseudoscourfieldia marina]